MPPRQATRCLRLDGTTQNRRETPSLGNMKASVVPPPKAIRRRQAAPQPSTLLRTRPCNLSRTDCFALSRIARLHPLSTGGCTNSTGFCQTPTKRPQTSARRQRDVKHSPVRTTSFLANASFPYGRPLLRLFRTDVYFRTDRTSRSEKDAIRRIRVKTSSLRRLDDSRFRRPANRLAENVNQISARLRRVLPPSDC